MMRRRRVRHFRPPRALAQGEAGQALFLEEGTAGRDQGLAQVAVVISHPKASTFTASRLRRAELADVKLPINTATLAPCDFRSGAAPFPSSWPSSRSCCRPF